MTRRHSTGLLTAMAEAQRRQQRQREAQERAWRAAQQEQEKARRAVTRAHARDQREALLAYQHEREADASAKTAEIDARVQAVASILPGVLAAPPFRLEQLIREILIPPFAPGSLGVPVPMPDERSYQVPPPSGLRAFTGAARRDYEQACAQARERYGRDCQITMQLEQHRQRQLADYHRQYQAWADSERKAILDHNGRVKLIGIQMTSREPDAICEYFATVLYASAGWPADFPLRARTAWEPTEDHLLADWELPDYNAVPATARYRYIKSDDRETQIPRPVAERKALYRAAIAQSALAVLAQIFRADHGRLVSRATVNGFVASVDPATGRRNKVFLLTVTADRHEFARLELDRVEPVSCVQGLRGQLSPRPENLVPVTPAQLASSASHRWADDDTESPPPDLLVMDPIDFEDLVASLFQAMGMEVMTTERSGDGGVDIRAMDSDPIRGGKLIIQVKRYSNTVPPSPVRDLYGTLLHEGGTKGILVTTAEFGPSAQEFAAGKPLSLIGGKQLLDLLSHHGIGNYTTRT